MIINEEGRCDCVHGSLYTSTRGWLCGLTTHTGASVDAGLTCRQMYGSSECRKHAHKLERIEKYIVVPIFPNEYIGNIEKVEE